MEPVNKVLLADAQQRVRDALSLLSIVWTEASGAERVYLADASNLLERAGGKLAKAAGGPSARFHTEEQP